MNKVKYKYIKNVISEDTCNLFTGWMKHKSRENNLIGDDQIPQSSSLHSRDDHLMRAILYHLKERIEYETCLKLQPTYAYTRLYYFGSDLKRHRDRPSCEISCTLTVNYDYADKDYQWPIYMGETPVVIPKGDAVIYKGMEIDHWRTTFIQPKPSYHHQIFLHYVDADGYFTDFKEEL